MTKNKVNRSEPFQRLIPEATVRDHYQGCMLGGAVGDALGAPVEFLSRKEILRQFGPQGITDLVPAYGKLGAITDDTQMTLFTAEGALRGYVRDAQRGLCHPPSVMHYAYLRWLHTQGEYQPDDPEFLISGWLIQQGALFARRAAGRTCVDALRNSPHIGRAARNDSKGCGGVMRVAPIGMLYQALSRACPEGRAANYGHAFALGCDAAALTHGHPTGQLTAGVMAAIVFDLLDGGDLRSSIDRATVPLKTRERHEETLAAIGNAILLAGSATEPANAIRCLGEGWVAEEALAIGIYCALKARSFEAGVMMAVNHDGDSDSTGLIAGHLLGAMQGRASIPDRWLAPLELRDVIEEMADDLATAGAWRLGEWDDSAAIAEEDYYTARYPGG